MKRIIALLLAFAVCFSLTVPASAASDPRNYTLEQTLASDLKSLSLFKGVSDTDFDLERAPTRAEALVMLIRVLGKESEALNGNWTHPFTDVPSWANNYVGYAYQKGLTKGVSNTQFGSGNANANAYLTFMLRALGYTDSGTSPDFTYDDPFTLAGSLDILPAEVDTSNFMRADAVLISYAALPVKLKGSDDTLSARLISAGVFTQAQYDTYYDSKAISAAESSSAMSAEEVYLRCSPAVFYIEVYDAAGNATASGSGFFIDSNGTAVTNYHVIDGAYSAKITMADSTTYDVEGVYDYSVAEDWAVIKISGSGFPYLKIGNPATASGGAEVFAIGSPEGLQNTISDGLVSNPKQTIDGMNFIQTTAAISHGSSGGALINQYGQVIGITSGSYTSGQNLNLALPMTYLSNMDTSSSVTLDYLVSTSDTALFIDVSQTNVGVTVGGTSTIFVKWHSDKESLGLKCSTADSAIATAAVGTSVSSDVVKLVITGVSAGTTTVYAYLDAYHSCAITVTADNNYAYERLRNYLQSEGQPLYMDDGSLSGYELTYTTGKIKNYILYALGEDPDLSFMSDVVTDGNEICTIAKLPVAGYSDFDCWMTDGEYAWAEASGSFDKYGMDINLMLSPLYYKNIGYDFDEYQYATYCSIDMILLLQNINDMLKGNNIPVNMGDLGFDTYYNEIYAAW